MTRRWRRGSTGRCSTTTRCAGASASTPVDREALIAQLKEIAPQILPYAGPVWKVMNEKRRAGKRILFEGAQGALLDIDFGTYPFVTSSNVIAGQAATGVGIGPGAIDYVLGIVKAYTTRVGEGPFPTELDDADGQRLGERGHEFGTTTGRKRRCGWFDAVLVRQTCAISGINGISLTKLDVLDGFETLKICVGYDLDGSGSITCRRRRTSRRAACRSTRKCRAGRSRPRARGPGPTCRRTRSSMCAGSRS